MRRVLQSWSLELVQHWTGDVTAAMNTKANLSNASTSPVHMDSNMMKWSQSNNYLNVKISTCEKDTWA